MEEVKREEDVSVLIQLSCQRIDSALFHPLDRSVNYITVPIAVG